MFNLLRHNKANGLARASAHHAGKPTPIIEDTGVCVRQYNMQLFAERFETCEQQAAQQT